MFAASKSGSAEVTDAQFNYVTMLLHGDGTNGSQNNTFVDSSTNNFTITRNGNTTQGTFTPYGSNWSSYLGTNGNYFTSGTNAALGLSTGDWTIEFFLNVSQFVDNQFLIDFRPSGSGGATQPLIYLTTAGTLLYFTASATRITSSTGVITLGTWAHIAVSRASGSTRMFVNGVQTGSTYTDSNDYGSSARFVNGTYGDAPGATNNNGGVISGYISNLRILKGTGLYTGSYTVPTGPLTAITNTSCLTFQSNRFVDNSGNSIAITPSGSPSVQLFNPFTRTNYYQPSVIGGSGYFDGSGDYLTAGTTASNFLCTGSATGITATFEAWVYPTAYSTGANSYNFSAIHAKGGVYFNFGVRNGAVRFYWYDGAEKNVTSASTSDVPLNAWTHIALTISGSTIKIYINGVLNTTSATYTGVASAGSGTTEYIGLEVNGTYFNGYMSNYRLTNTVVYSAAFTPSTTPLTVVTGTQLLFNYTNAGILDNAMMNDLETVGNAQISTSVKKYGTGSLAFDGTGDGLVVPDNVLADFGSGNFTIEFWLYLNSVSGEQFIYAQTTDSNPYTSPVRIQLNGSQLQAFFSTSQGSWATQLQAGAANSTATWYQFAIVRNGTSVVIYRNGTSYDSGTLTGTLYNSSEPVRIGYTIIGGSSYASVNGYIDDLRITKGVARYTATFTPPTAAFADKG